MLALNGLSVSGGKLTGGLARIGELIQPLYAKILGQSRSASRWKMDETRWSVFAEVNGKVGFRLWLWVVITHNTCAYLLVPSRSSDVPKNHLGEDAEGILNADRSSDYKALGQNIHWQGAILFVDHPEVPMDNNESERCLRNPIIGQKTTMALAWSGAERSPLPFLPSSRLC